MFNLFGKNDTKLKADVVEELKWDPSVTACDIITTADRGIITLRGVVPHFLEKKMAEAAAQRVGGVRAIVDEIEVSLPDLSQREDEKIAEAALLALKWNSQIPQGINVVVNNAWVTLSGEASWEYERCAAKRAVSELMGVRGVTNNITIRSQELPADVRTLIGQALTRSAECEGRKIEVDVDDGHVSLSGSVNSYSERSAAERAAWRAPGVTSVTSTLMITHS